MFWIKIKHPQCRRPLLLPSIPRVCCDQSWDTWKHWTAALAHTPLLAGTFPRRIPFLHLVLLHGMTYICTHVAKTPRIRRSKKLHNFHYKEVTEKLLFWAKEMPHTSISISQGTLRASGFSYYNSSRQARMITMNSQVILTAKEKI